MVQWGTAHDLVQIDRQIHISRMSHGPLHANRRNPCENESILFERMDAAMSRAVSRARLAFGDVKLN